MGSGEPRARLTIALIPAAGKSVRMGRPKLLLQLGDKTVIEHVIATLRQAGIEHVLVVVGPHVAKLAQFSGQSGADVLLLEEETPDMRATVEHGLDWIEKQFKPQPDDSWLLVPADHPTLHPAVVEELLSVRKIQAKHTIIVPTHAGKRGHPTLIAWKHVAEIRTFPRERGLNSYLREHMSGTLELPMDDESVLWDLDTPEDYERLTSSHNPRA